MNIDAIQREIEAGYINEQRHPSSPLRILNYSQKAQFNWRWNDETMACRGLIVDDEWNVVARPFEKFFSVDQLKQMGQSVPAEPFDVYEKVDGSLGILYFLDGKPQIASRGSFDSEQAIRATRMLAEKYGDAQLDERFTYLFEIIYPENRIVVNYEYAEQLVLLAIIETATGKEWPLHAYDSVFPVVKKYDGFRQFDELLKVQDAAREGFVVRFASGRRVKIKFDEYKRLHALMTRVSPRAIWDVLRSGGDLAQFIENVPDEFLQWVQETENELRAKFCRIETIARSQMVFSGSRKEIAEKIRMRMYPSIMFSILDGKDYADQIWRMIRPSGKAFRCDGE